MVTESKDVLENSNDEWMNRMLDQTNILLEEAHSALEAVTAVHLIDTFSYNQSVYNRACALTDELMAAAQRTILLNNQESNTHEMALAQTVRVLTECLQNALREMNQNESVKTSKLVTTVPSVQSSVKGLAMVTQFHTSQLGHRRFIVRRVL